MKRFSKILCVLDPAQTMSTAIVQAMKMADAHQADVTFMAVLRGDTLWRRAFRRQPREAKDLNEFVANKRDAIAQTIRAHAPSATLDVVVEVGIPFIEIIKRVIHQRHDLVVKCAEDTTWKVRVLGSEDMHLLRKCPCPVLMLQPGQQSGFRRVLATVDVNDDFSELDEGAVQGELNQEVLGYSAAVSVAEPAEMHIGSAWEAYAEEYLRYNGMAPQPEEKVAGYVEQIHAECKSRLENLVEKMAGELGEQAMNYLQPRLHMVKGKAATEIPLMVEAYGIDLLVMGTVGRVGIPGLIIGNTAESILERTQCSVLAIKPQGFRTPVE